MTTDPATSTLDVILVDDSKLFREGLAGLLTAAGVRVVAERPNTLGLIDVVRSLHPDVVVLDARMPPTHTDEGIRAALEIRSSQRDVGVLVLSTYAEGGWARQLFAAGTRGIGYLLKDRVNDSATLIDAMRRVTAGDSVVDPEVIQRLLQITNHRSALGVLSPREREVLDLMAQGRSNVGIGVAMHLSPRTVETYINSIFTKLSLDNSDSSSINRRVLAVLAYLEDRP